MAAAATTASPAATERRLRLLEGRGVDPREDAPRPRLRDAGQRRLAAVEQCRLARADVRVAVAGHDGPEHGEMRARVDRDAALHVDQALERVEAVHRQV